MRCPYCHSPTALTSGSSYGLAETDEDYFCEYQCGLPKSSPGEACRETFLVLVGDSFKDRHNFELKP